MRSTETLLLTPSHQGLVRARVRARANNVVLLEGLKLHG